MAASMALRARRILPVAKLAGMRTDWGVAQFRRQIDDTNGDPIPAPVAVHVQVPDSGAGRTALAALMEQAARVSKLLAPDRAPQAVCVDVPRRAAAGTVDLVTLVRHLRRLFVRPSSPEVAFIVLTSAHNLSRGFLDSLAKCGIHSFVLRPDRDGASDWSGRLECALRCAPHGGGLKLAIQLELGAPELGPGDLSGFAPAAALAHVDRVILIPPLGVRWDCRARASRAPLAPSEEACCEIFARLENAGLVRRSPMEFARHGIADRPSPLWPQNERHAAVPAPERGPIVIGLGANAQSQINEWVFLNEADRARFKESIACGRLGVAHGTFLTAAERLRLGIIHAVLMRGAVDIQALRERHGCPVHSPVLECSRAFAALVERGVIVAERNGEVVFASHAMLHVAEICMAFGCPPSLDA